MKKKKTIETIGVFQKGLDVNSIQLSFANHLHYSLLHDLGTGNLRDFYKALALVARDRVIERWMRSQQIHQEKDAKRIYYLSAEYLMGRMLVNNLINLGIYDETQKALRDIGLSLEEIAAEEPDMGLGNGGLGRLAACFLDSIAAQEIPCYGYGIRYEFGIFDQEIRQSRQVEVPEIWLKYGNPWEIARPEYSYTVKFKGVVHETFTANGGIQVEWRDTEDIIGMAYDIPIDGYDCETVNTLRLWSARASKEFDLNYFQGGDYLKAVEEKNISENISKVLYPNDQIFVGRELRLKQQYFFVSCSIQDIISRYLKTHENFDQFTDKVAIQLNDTHPSLAVVELMRILLDIYQMEWEKAWEITTACCAYTNHTLLSEALEKWPVRMFESLLPRHLTLIYEINRRFLREVSVRYIGEHDRLRRMSIIEEGEDKKIRMAHLAIVGSHTVNGVAELHSKLLKEKEFKDFDEYYPHKFINKTNGITPRRWLLAANPRLADLITANIGERWTTDLFQLREIETHIKDVAFRESWKKIKKDNKERFLKELAKKDITGVNPASIFDFQVKRIHEYKRQLLNILHVLYCWVKLKENPESDTPPRTFFFGGKAAPSYTTAKLIIQLICQVGEIVNRDKETRDFIKVIFIPNYRVSLAELIFPAADLSEQISTAGFEASGTSNMKFALNGALTIGTLDGANIEIMEAVGRENIFIFGRTAQEVEQLRPDYRPSAFCEKDPILKKVIELIKTGMFSPEAPMLFRPLIDTLLYEDRFMVLADFEAYQKCHMAVDTAYLDQDAWTHKSIINVARMGQFSSDNTIAAYNQEIWKVEPVPVVLEHKLMSPI